jgi:transcriptional regulator with XRE-family HTH domain
MQPRKMGVGFLAPSVIQQTDATRMESRKPFPEAVFELLSEREMSQRELARRAQAKSGGFPHITTLNSVLLGEVEPSINMMEAVAKGFNLSPNYFAEYRLAVARDRLDPNRVGLARALRNLAETTLALV